MGSRLSLPGMPCRVSHDDLHLDRVDIFSAEVADDRGNVDEAIGSCILLLSVKVRDVAASMSAAAGLRRVVRVERA